MRTRICPLIQVRDDAEAGELNSRGREHAEISILVRGRSRTERVGHPRFEVLPIAAFQPQLGRVHNTEAAP